MTNEDLAKYLSSASSLKEIILDNFEYKDIPSKILQKDLKKYDELYKNIISYKELSKAYNELIKPSLSEELSSLNRYSTKEEWLRELDKLSLIAKDLIPKTNNHTDKINNRINNDITITKIQLANFRFFINEENNNTFEPNNHGMLIYGENGSGKSSLFKAFNFLSKTQISENEFRDNKNIFNLENPTSLNFEFSNGKTPLEINDDNLTVDSEDTFITNLSIFKPILNYQKLLRLSYNENSSANEQKNLYTFFEKILEDYPIGGTSKSLKEFEDEEYFEYFKDIIQNQLFANINLFLEKFNHGFKMTKIKLSGIGKKAFLEIDYFEKDITNHKYHLFLNEARLSALGMSVYFAIIKKQFDLLENDSLKILVLDDLLISLDMNNRLSLIKILQDEFMDYQIFFFTHEKGLFDLFKEKMNLKAYEIYVSKKDNYEVPFIKQSNSLIKQAIQQKDTYNYGCSANLLRQATEELLCRFLKDELTIGDRCKVLDLDRLLRQAIKFGDKNEETVTNLRKLKTFKRVLLNDASHYNDTNIYKTELEEAIEVIESLDKIIVGK